MARPTSVIVLRVPGVVITGVPGVGRNLFSDGTVTLSSNALFDVLHAEHHGTTWYWRCRLASSSAVGGDAMAEFIVMGVPDHESTASLTAVNFYAVADGAVVVCPATEEAGALEGARAACGVTVNLAYQSGRQRPFPLLLVGPAPVTVSEAFDNEVVARGAPVEQLTACACSDIDVVTNATIADAVGRVAVSALIASTPAFNRELPAAFTGASFRGIVLKRFPNSKVYLVKVVNGAVQVGDTVFCAVNPNDSIATVRSIRCFATGGDVTGASRSCVVTLCVDSLYQGCRDFAASRFDVLCTAMNGGPSLSLPACLMRLTLDSPFFVGVEKGEDSMRVAVAGVGGVSVGRVIGVDKQTNILYVPSVYGTTVHAWPSARVSVCVYHRHQVDEEAFHLAIATVNSAVEMMAIHREVALLTTAVSADPTIEERVMRFLSLHEGTDYALTRDANFWLSLNVTRHLLTPVSMDLLRLMRPSTSERRHVLRWRSCVTPTMPTMSLLTLISSVADAAARRQCFSALCKTATLQPTPGAQDVWQFELPIFTLFPPSKRVSLNPCPSVAELVVSKRALCVLERRKVWLQATFLTMSWALREATAAGACCVGDPVTAMVDVMQSFADWLPHDAYLQHHRSLASQPHLVAAIAYVPWSYTFLHFLGDLFPTQWVTYPWTQSTEQQPPWVSLYSALALCSHPEVHERWWRLHKSAVLRQTDRCPGGLQSVWASEVKYPPTEIWSLAANYFVRRVLRHCVPSMDVIDHIVMFLCYCDGAEHHSSNGQGKPPDEATSWH